MSQDIQLSAVDRQRIGKEIKAYRDLTIVSQAAFGDHVGTSGQTIGNAERGASVVSVAMLKRITDAAGIVWKPSVNSHKKTTTGKQPPPKKESKAPNTPVSTPDLKATESKTGNPSKPKQNPKQKKKRQQTPIGAFKPPLERYYLTQYQRHTGVVMVGYAGVFRGKPKHTSKFGVHLNSKSYEKKDLLMIARDADWDIVKSQSKWRKPIKALGLVPEAHLAKKLDGEKYLKPFTWFTNKDGSIRKAVPVKVVLRNGLVVSCEMLKQDHFQLVCSVSSDSERTLILIFKHAILSVEKA